MVQGIDATFSLLQSQQRNRIAEDRRRAEKDERNAAIVKLLVKGGELIGNQVLANKTLDFMNTTEQRNAQALAARADSNVAYAQGIWGQIEGSNKSAKEFMMDRVDGLVRARLDSESPDWMENLDEYESILYKRKSELADLQLKQLREARDIYEGKGMDNYENRLEMVRQQYGPANNMGDLVTSTLAGFFDGKSKEDLDREELLAYRDFIDDQEEGSRAYYAKKLQLIVDSLEEVGDMATSKAYADSMMLREPTPEERIVTQTKKTIAIVGDRAFTKTATETYDPASRFGMNQPITVDEQLGGSATDLRTDEELVKVAMDSFDIAKWVDDNFTEKAKAEFHKVTAQAGNAISNIKTLEQYNALATTFDSFASVTGNYKNKRADEFYNSMIKVYFEQVGYGKMLTVMKQRNSTNATERAKGEKAFAELMVQFGEFNLTANEVADLMREIEGRGDTTQPAATTEPEIVSTRTVDSNVRTTGRGVGGKKPAPRPASTPTISPQITDQATFDALTGNERQFALSLLESDTEASLFEKIRSGISLIGDPEINVEASPEYKEMIKRKYGITL